MTLAVLILLSVCVTRHVEYTHRAGRANSPGCSTRCLNRQLSGESPPVVQDSKGCPKIHKCRRAEYTLER